MLEKFKDLRWVGAQPEFLDYPRAQILLIGYKTGLGKDDGTNDGGDDAVDVLSELEEQDVWIIRSRWGKTRLGYAVG